MLSVRTCWIIPRPKRRLSPHFLQPSISWWANLGRREYRGRGVHGVWRLIVVVTLNHRSSNAADWAAFGRRHYYLWNVSKSTRESLFSLSLRRILLLLPLASSLFFWGELLKYTHPVGIAQIHSSRHYSPSPGGGAKRTWCTEALGSQIGRGHVYSYRDNSFSSCVVRRVAPCAYFLYWIKRSNEFPFDGAWISQINRHFAPHLEIVDRIRHIGNNQSQSSWWKASVRTFPSLQKYWRTGAALGRMKSNHENGTFLCSRVSLCRRLYGICCYLIGIKSKFVWHSNQFEVQGSSACRRPSKGVSQCSRQNEVLVD